MTKNLCRFTGAFLALLGLAYLGHQVFVRGSQGLAAPAQASVATSMTHPAANSSPIVSNADAYAVYPDKATDTALGLSYSSFVGDFTRNVIMTPLPPGVAGHTTLRIQPRKGRTLNLTLNDTRCANPVQIVVSRVNERKPLGAGTLSVAEPKISVGFADGNIPPLLVEVQMEEKALNNYYCGVVVNWSE